MTNATVSACLWWNEAMNPSRSTLMTILPIVVGFGLLGASLFLFRYQVALGAILGGLGALVLIANLVLLRRGR
ncbi:hypothetical protein [Galactobacter valiniphilus]|uniref:hypothetical protein n=1 Tax=Galactobacter valiniphilus TaxID=2676122 RepID=UPI0011C487D8|nr:hypothetical protein [Galactobacter valiniphilus]